MSVQNDIEDVRAGFAEAERALKDAYRALRRVHNLAASKVAQHGQTLGLSSAEIVEAGTPKDESPEGGG